MELRGNTLLYWLFCFLLLMCLSCSRESTTPSQENTNTSMGSTTVSSIYNKWEITGSIEWNDRDKKCETDVHGDTKIFWYVNETGQLVKYAKLPASLGGFCSQRTYETVISEAAITLKNEDGEGNAKTYRYELSETTLTVYDDEESVADCQEELVFTKIKDNTAFENSIKGCVELTR